MGFNCPNQPHPGTPPWHPHPGYQVGKKVKSKCSFQVSIQEILCIFAGIKSCFFSLEIISLTLAEWKAGKKQTYMTDLNI